VSFAEMNEATLDLHLNLNVKAPYLLTQQLISALIARKGVVINISSYFSHRMLPGRPSTTYSLSKGAIDAFTKSLAYEMGPQGVRVNAIAPGTVNTSLVRGTLDRLTEEGKTKFAEIVKMIYPLGHIGEPDDVSGAAVFLASDQARWITGAILAVDGGLTTNLTSLTTRSTGLAVLAHRSPVNSAVRRQWRGRKNYEKIPQARV